MKEKLIHAYHQTGKRALRFPKSAGKAAELSKGMKRNGIPIPEVSEVEAVRHFTRLSSLNFGVDSGFYPLGSCTMKYNPKLNEKTSSLPEFACLHPLVPAHASQGVLQIIFELQEYLKEITGMKACSLQPAAGASGELTGLLIIKKYHQVNKNLHKNEIIIPDSAHGTNPASVAMAGFKVVEVKSDERGWVDLAGLRAAVNENTAGLMITNPNTLGLFDGNIMEIASIIHQQNGLVHYDGANLNAVMGKCRPYDMGFDIVHLNLHKTFGAPHGGGGPGSGPVGVAEKLKDFLPVPVAGKKDGKYFLDFSLPHSIGKMMGFWGNFLVMVKSYTYIRMLGAAGLKEASETAVLNANYLLKKLEAYYKREFSQHCMHEFVLSGANLPNGIHTLDIAKRLLDYGCHAPTIYFPLIVKEAIMVEPTETESRENLDLFAEIMKKIRTEADSSPDLLKNAPVTTPVRRLDEVTAARKPELRYGCT
ncbi:MAG: aminomethyl-transferring glycine dehydrogenase subunit GcvPB [Candidatus Wallbacteria bacterium]|nr:aminomethyl-transferring glycine dehydrogenase subunit GcvPB [Candidatus Wallbacteria bacterium]